MIYEERVQDDGAVFWTMYDYDSLGRLALTMYPDGLTLHYAYDRDPERISAITYSGADVVIVAADGSMSTVPAPWGGVASDITYDPAGQVASYRLADGSVVTLSRNLAGE